MEVLLKEKKNSESDLNLKCNRKEISWEINWYKRWNDITIVLF